MLKKILIIPALISCHLIFGQADSTIVPVVPEETTPVVKEERERRDQRPMKDRIDLGFGTGFWITPSQTYVELAPVLAYRFPKALITGVGYRYIYRHQRYTNDDLHSYGPNVFARLNVTKRIYLWTEYEILNSQFIDDSYVGDDIKHETSSVDSWFAGLGFMRRMGRRGGVSMQILYNILYDRSPTSPYYSAFTYRVGYFF